MVPTTPFILEVVPCLDKPAIFGYKVHTLECPDISLTPSSPNCLPSFYHVAPRLPSPPTAFSRASAQKSPPWGGQMTYDILTVLNLQQHDGERSSPPRRSP